MPEPAPPSSVRLTDARPAVVLIGMPGCGKSTVAAPLAARLGVPLIDPDRRIEAGEGRALGAVSAGLDRAGFLDLEDRYNRAVPAGPAVIAPGGSVIYCEPAMRRYRTFAAAVWLDVPVPVLETRLGCLKTRAVVIAPGATLHDLAAERRPLLERWADLHVHAADRPPGEVADEIAAALRPASV